MMPNTPNTIVTAEEFKHRRQKFMQNMLPNSIAILPGHEEISRSADGHFSFRQNSDFYYLTGFNEPDAIAVLLTDSNGLEKYLLFNRPRDPLMEIWNGLRAGQEGAEKIYGADKAFATDEFVKMLPELLTGREYVYFAFGRQMGWDRKINLAINQLRKKVRAGVDVPHTLINPEIFLHEMRLIKSAAEIKTLQKACDISVDAHIKAMQICKPHMHEYELQAVIMQEFVSKGAFEPAYYPIIGAGKNSCILHYHENNCALQKDDIVLIDAGAEYQVYSADITRSFPASGKFSAEQRAIYEIVLRAQEAAIAHIKPGILWISIQEMIIKIMTEGLIALGILKGNIEDLIQQKAYAQFYMHNSGHWLGLDTHDVGSYKQKGEWRTLQAGMVLTVEPGIYISENIPDIDPRFKNIGIRIEDDVLVTPTGHDVLTKRVPKSIDEIEALMRG